MLETERGFASAFVGPQSWKLWHSVEYISADPYKTTKIFCNGICLYAFEDKL